MERPRETAFFESINRPNLLMGADRKLVLFAATMSAAIAISAMALWSICVGVVIWPFALQVFRMMAKADPLMFPVYLKHVQYLKSYPAKSLIDVEDYTTPTNWR